MNAGNKSPIVTKTGRPQQVIILHPSFTQNCNKMATISRGGHITDAEEAGVRAAIVTLETVSTISPTQGLHLLGTAKCSAGKSTPVIYPQDI